MKKETTLEIFQFETTSADEAGEGVEEKEFWRNVVFEPM